MGEGKLAPFGTHHRIARDHPPATEARGAKRAEAREAREAEAKATLEEEHSQAVTGWKMKPHTPPPTKLSLADMATVVTYMEHL
jgi:hypothetical protein